VTAGVPVVAYYWGDDRWAVERAVIVLARALERASGAAPDRWRVAGKDTTPAEIGGRVTTAPMFGGGTIAIVSDPYPLVRARDGADAMAQVIGTVAPGNTLVFVDIAQDPRKRAAWSRSLGGAVVAAGGTEKAFQAPGGGGEMAAWIQGRATDLGLRLEPEAARELATRLGAFVTETDVDRTRIGEMAVGELEKLALYRLDGQVTIDDVRALVPEVIPDSTWAFLDAVTERRSAQAGPLLDRILESSAEQLLIVQLHRRLRELLIAADHRVTGAPPAELVKLLGIHPFRVQKAAEAARRWTVPELDVALEGLLELDAMTKRVADAEGSDRQRRMAWVTWVAERIAVRSRPGASGPASKGAPEVGGFDRGGSTRTRPR
jgi:DNA polymerase III delta subunit